MDSAQRLARDYVPTLLSYLGRPDERALRSAYELGRNALVEGLGLLDLVTVHNATVTDVVARSKPEDVPDLVSGSGRFLVEVLSAFEMAQRAFQESVATAKADAEDPP